MLRIHFTPEDLTRIRVAGTPDPLWEIACSLHRLQTTRGRWAYADWYRTTRDTLAGTGLGAAVRRLLIPVLPRASYFPDCLTPYEAADGLDRGLAAIVDTPPARVAQFTEPAPMFKGRLDRRRSTATAYAWLVWETDTSDGTRLIWIPPCRRKLERNADHSTPTSRPRGEN